MSIKICMSPDCTVEIKNSYNKGCVGPTITYDGAVLATYERNGYDDSDFYAIVWDAETNDFKHIEYASTRGWTYHNNATVDATPDVIAIAEEKLTAVLTQRWIADAEAEALKPLKGRTVKSTTKRGKNVGIVGQVMWYGEDSYRSSRWATYYKVGVKVKGETKLRYIDADSAEVINPTPIDTAAIAQHAKYRASQHGWRIDF